MRDQNVVHSTITMSLVNENQRMENLKEVLNLKKKLKATIYYR